MESLGAARVARVHRLDAPERQAARQRLQEHRATAAETLRAAIGKCKSVRSLSLSGGVAARIAAVAQGSLEDLQLRYSGARVLPSEALPCTMSVRVATHWMSCSTLEPSTSRARCSSNV